MTKEQISYYTSLSKDDQYILKLAALKIGDINAYAIFKMQITRHLPEIQIRKCITSAFQKKLLINSSAPMSFVVAPEFLLYIYPQLIDIEQEKEKIEERLAFLGYDTKTAFGRFLFYLFFYDEEKLRRAENDLVSGYTDKFDDLLIELFENESYQPVIPLISTWLISSFLLKKFNKVLVQLQSLSEFDLYLKRISIYFSQDQLSELAFLDIQLKLQLGKFSQLVESDAIHPAINNTILAIYALTQKDITKALAYFAKVIKMQQVEYKGSPLPIQAYESFFYLTALLCLPPEESVVIFTKIESALIKRIFTPFDSLFEVVVAYGLNDKARLNKDVDLINKRLNDPDHDYITLMIFFVLYLVDRKPTKVILDIMFQVTQKAFASGYFLLAYEAAYALQQWNKDQEISKFYDTVASCLDYQPILSQISRQEEWEKSLSMLLAMDLNKATVPEKGEKGKARIVYYVNPLKGVIQPVLQTHLAKGGWSKGRNIALKTFFEGSPKGMTEQDFRVAKYVHVVDNYWGSNDYDLSENAFKELVGHPYLFLLGTTDVPVELLAAQPVIQVTKSPKGYSLSTNIQDVTDALVIEKETNTRYKVYDLNLRQRQIIQIINQQQIVVPEFGKEKLIQLLGGFSKQMTVHSDLLATESERTNVKEVDVDSRIRVQLLPLGDGLKAELFAKPFGAFPPYCKPGKGGKVLITDDHGQQLQVKRDLNQELEYANALMNAIQSLESLNMTNELIAFDEPMDSLHLLDILAAHQDKCVVEWPEGERFKIKGSANFGNLNLRIKSKSNWFELQGELKVDEETVITIQQLLALTAKGHDRFIELGQGAFLSLSYQLKKQLEELRAFSVSGKDGVKINKFASVALGDFFEEVTNLKADNSWKEFRQRIEAVQETQTPIPINLQAELRPYQEDGFRWLDRLAAWEGGACLADDMGLGKTIQTLAILLRRSHHGPALVVCPVSVLSNWANETARFAPTLHVKTLSSNNREQTLKSLEAGDLLIISYGLLQSQEKTFAEIPFSTVVLDEAHTIKNYATKTSKAAMQLQASFRIALTGTPIQNHLGEIWNLFNFVNPGLLGTLQHFNDMFIKPDDEATRRHLKKLIAPFILRRTKSAVLDELPPKTEIVKKVPLSDQEMAFYEALRRQAIANLESDDAPQGAKHLKALAEITRLRQACCNPALVDPAVAIPSSKLAAFLEIIAELTENKHRALVFSQFVTHLSIVRAALDRQGCKYQYLDGSTSIAEREKSVKKFQSGEGDLFLISLKAGGLGLNLTAADYVIHLDPWWNPAVEDQASDRAHRIGQIRPVTIYRLVAENTIEEKIIQLHNTKRDLADTLLEGSDQSAKLSMSELMSLIKERD